MDKRILINILLIILVIAIATIVIFFIRTKVNNKVFNKGRVLYEDSLDNFLNIINFVLIGIVFIQIMMSLTGKQYGGIVATVTLAIINLNRRASKFLITEDGIGVSDQFNGIIQFIEWDNLETCKWNSFDRSILSIDTKLTDICKFTDFKIKDCDVKIVDSILRKYCSVKYEI